MDSQTVVDVIVVAVGGHDDVFCSNESFQTVPVSMLGGGGGECIKQAITKKEVQECGKERGFLYFKFWECRPAFKNSKLLTVSCLFL